MLVFRSRIFRSWANSTFPRYCIALSFSGACGGSQSAGAARRRVELRAKRVTGGVHFGSQDLKNLEGQQRFSPHEVGKAVPGEEAHLRAGVRKCSERIR